jgi:hypothetical protein
MLIAATVTLLLCAVSYKVRLSRFTETHQIIETKFDELENDVLQVVSSTIETNDTIASLRSEIMDAINSCSVVPSTLREEIQAQTRSVMEPYTDLVQEYAAMIEPLPGLYEDAHRTVHSMYPFIAFAPLVPTLVVGLICLLMVGEGLLTACVGHSGFHHLSAVARCEDWGLRLSSSFMALVVLAIAIFSAVELEAAFLSAKFCVNVDENVLDLASEQPEVVYNLTRHYVVGDVYNPILIQGSTIRKYALTVLYLWGRIKTSPLGGACTSLEDISVEQTARRARTLWRRARKIMRIANIYPVYDEIVHDGLCGSMLHALGSVILFQTVVCLVCFPICAVLTHRFLSRWADWKAQAEADGVTKQESWVSDDSD